MKPVVRYFHGSSKCGLAYGTKSSPYVISGTHARMHAGQTGATTAPSAAWNLPRASRSIVVVLLLAATAFGQSGTRVSELVRRDWYFRESLVAIDDWETILPRWESQTVERDRTPIYPVPSNGEAVAWPNPVPAILLPDGDQHGVVRLRATGGSVELERIEREGKVNGQSVRAEELVRGYWHPGGGGRSRWNHQYHRRFDGITAFRPRVAPFAIEVVAPTGFQHGVNELDLRWKNVTGDPLAISVRLKFWHRNIPPGNSTSSSPNARSSARGDVIERHVGENIIEVPGHGERSERFGVELSAPGGGMLVVSMQAAGQSYWFPLLTHVEDVPAVHAGIERILSDTPAAAAATRLGELRRRVSERPTGDSWRRLFEQSCSLRDELLLGRIDFDRLFFVKRQPFDSEQPFMDAHHCYNPPGGAIYQLSPVRPEGRVTPLVDSLGLGIYRDLCLDWDAERLLFAFGNGSDRAPPAIDRVGKLDYDLYEIAADGTQLRQVTSGPKNDCEPFYLPNGQIGFTSDRAEQVVMCGSDIHVASLYTMHRDGPGIRQLGFNVFNEFNPSVLPDGRILYDRWEYNERSVTSLHKLFTIHPDGTHAAPFYGNATIRPNVIMFPRAVPGSHQVMALFTAHHGQTHGPIGLIDHNRGLDGPGPVSLLTPDVPTTAEHIEDSRWGWYSDPRPLSETTYLCSYTPTVLPWLANSWAIYVGDRHGNLALVVRDPGISCAEPTPVVRLPRPFVLPPAESGADADGPEATLLVMDVYQGLPGVPRGTARYLRVIEDVSRKGVPTGGVICTSGTQIYTIKRVFGVVPIESDGSAHFTVPANRNVYFEVLDDQRREIQRMRSVVCLKPNEQRTCIGCHEPRTQAPANLLAAAFSRPPSRPRPPPWGTHTISFLRDVQPLINKHCTGCHAHDRSANSVILTDDLSDQFTIAYEELLPYISVANAKRWDHPDDVLERPPYTYGSHVSRLTRLLSTGHHGVSLSGEEWDRLVTWIDANCVYYDRYQSDPDNRHLFTGRPREELDSVYAQRCARCHDANRDGRNGTWWLSLNRHNVAASRALAAPLASSAGGWGRCDEVVFTNTIDPDYQRLLAALTLVQQRLNKQPRADLLSVQEAAAEAPGR